MNCGRRRRGGESVCNSIVSIHSISHLIASERIGVWVSRLFSSFVAFEWFGKWPPSITCSSPFHAPPEVARTRREVGGRGGVNCIWARNRLLCYVWPGLLCSARRVCLISPRRSNESKRWPERPNSHHFLIFHTIWFNSISNFVIQSLISISNSSSSRSRSRPRPF